MEKDSGINTKFFTEVEYQNQIGVTTLIGILLSSELSICGGERSYHSGTPALRF